MNIFQRRKKHILLAIGVFSLNFAVDRFTKYLAVTYLKGAEAVRFFRDLLVLVYTENGGAFLSLGANWGAFVKNAVLLFIPLLVCFGIFLYLLFREDDLRRVGMIACIVGGGAGNLLDRLFNDFRVVDFINVGIGPVRTGILNFADLSVTFGVLALLVYEFLTIKKQNPRSRPGEE
jgi:signal peptidase II